MKLVTAKMHLECPPIDRSRVVLVMNDRCPFCARLDIRNKPLKPSENGLGEHSRVSRCAKCKASWQEFYKLDRVVKL